MDLCRLISSFNHFFSCITIFTIVLQTVEPQSQSRNISESDLKAAVLRLHPAISTKRLEEILRCTQPTRNAQIYLKCERRVNAILLQTKWRTFGEPCNATEEDNIDMWSPPPLDTHPPTPNFEERRMIESYLDWQRRIVDSGKIFCNPLKHLTCAADQTCQCARLLSLNPDLTPPDFQCIAKSGSYCSNPGYHIYYFYDLRDGLYWDPFTQFPVGRKEPPCFVTNGESGECFESSIFPAKICEAQAQKIIYQRATEKFYHLRRNNKLLTLNYGHNCNYEVNKKFITSPDSDLDNVQTRLDVIKQLIRDKVQLCRAEFLWVCGTNNTCDCYPPTIWNSSKNRCVFKTPDEYCENEEKIRKETSTFSGFSRQNLFRGYNDASKCGRCRRDLGLYPKPFCGCEEDYEIGKNCTKLTRFLYKFSSASMLPSDISDPEENLKLFLDFNKKAIEFYNLFAIPGLNRCPGGDEFEKIEFEAHDLIRRIRKLDFPGTRVTQEKLKQLTDSIANFTKEFKEKDPLMLCATYMWRPNREDKQSGRGLPPPPESSPLLFFFRCRSLDYFTATGEFKCAAHGWNEYVDPLVQRLGHIHTLQFGESCPRDLNEIIAEELLDQKDGERETYERIFDMLDDLRVGQTRFCDKKANLTCKLNDKDDLDGKCVLVTSLMPTTESAPDEDYDYGIENSGSKLREFGLFCLLIVSVLLT